MKKVAVIGAGAAGLAAGKHCLDHSFSCDIFEQTGTVGGTWNYTDYVDFDENGLPVHSSMYKELKTNAPKESMLLEGLTYPESLRDSFIGQDQVLEYLQTYCNKFKLEPHVKFYTQVIKVDPQNDSTWLIEYNNVKSKKKSTSTYDAVMICNGHYKDTFIPTIPGFETFPGDWTHSHRYRHPVGYNGKKVLLIGAGPSGLDIAQQIAKVAAKVFLSYNPETNCSKTPNPEVVQKNLIKKFSGNTAFFIDGKSQAVDSVMFCTGYLYSFPFLTENCGIKITNNCVQPLYKQIISIEHPTMAFIGLNFKIYPFPLFDIQSRFFLASLSGNFQLPAKGEMMVEFETELSRHQQSGESLRKFHFLGEKQGAYFDELALLAGIKRIPPVFHKLYLRVTCNRDFNVRFRIVDDETFEEVQQ